MWPQAAWAEPLLIDIKDREDAERQAVQLHGTTTVWADAPQRNGLLGHAVVKARQRGSTYTATRRVTYTNITESNIFVAELGVILAGLEYFRSRPMTERWVTYGIGSDSQAALKASHNPHRQSGQYIIRQIVEQVEQLWFASPGFPRTKE